MEDSRDKLQCAGGNSTAFFQSTRHSINRMKMLAGSSVLILSTELTVILSYKIKPKRLVRLSSYRVTIKTPVVNAVEKVRAVKE